MAAKRRKPWKRLPDEPLDSWVRFLFYLHMGARRSVSRCCRLQNNLPKGAQATGPYWEDSHRFRWAERAAAYDIHHIRRAGARVVALQVALMEESIRFVFRAFRDPACRPKNNAELRETASALSKLVPEDTVRLFLARPRVLREGGEGDDGEHFLEEVPEVPGPLHAGGAGGGPVGEAAGDSEAAPDAAV